ncbi:MAG: ABC transporter ATP-binding protein, partial [Actinomycetota bacterium]
MAMLELDDVHVYYGNIQAVKGISLTVDDGEIVTLIGGNGAGKTTTLKTISGVRRPAPGKITFVGERIDRLPPHEIVMRGVCQAPEGRRIFPRMSVKENLEMGAYARRGADLSDNFDRVFTLFPVLKERFRQAGGTLSGGEQQ